MGNIVSNLNSDPSQDQPQPTQDTSYADQTVQPTATATPAPAQAPATGQNQPQSEAPEFSTLTPDEQHASFFKQAFGVLSGGSQTPQRNPDGSLKTDASGRVVTQPATVKQLGAGILAGALASMMAGYAAGAPRRDGNGIVEANLPAAAAAGAQAGAQQTQTARVQQSQQQADAQRLQQYVTTKQNMELHALALTNARLGDEAIDRHTAQDQPLYDWLSSERASNPDIDKMIRGDELGESEMNALMRSDAANGTRDTAVAAGSRPRFDANGKPTGEREQTYMVIGNDAKVALTDALREHYGMEALPNGTQVPLSVLMKHGIQAGQAANASQIMDILGEVAGTNTTFGELVKKPAYRVLGTQQGLNALQGLAGLNPAEAMKVARDMIQKPETKAIGGALAGALENEFGFTPIKLQQIANAADAQKKTAENAVDPKKRPADPKLVAGLPALLAGNPGLTPNDVKTLLTGLPTDRPATQAEYEKVLEDSRAQQNVNSQRRLAENREAQSEARTNSESVLAVDPNKQDDPGEVMSRGAANAKGLFQVKMKDPEQVRTTILGFNDVQNKLNELTNSLGALDQGAGQSRLIADAISEGKNDFTLGAFGTHIPLEQINKLLSRENFQGMTDASKRFVTAFLGAREAVTQLPRLQTFGKSNRMSQQQMEAAVKMLPGAEMDNSKTARDRMTGIQSLLDPLRKGMPRYPGTQLLAPAAGSSGSASHPVYARNPQTGQRVMSNDGGKTWQAAQ